MRRVLLALALVDLAVIATWLVLRFAWFPGGLEQGVGCDDSHGATSACSQRVDLLVALGGTAIVLVLVTLGACAVVLARQAWLALRR